jgi:hypothetical protein
LKDVRGAPRPEVSPRIIAIIQSLPLFPNGFAFVGASPARDRSGFALSQTDVLPSRQALLSCSCKKVGKEHGLSRKRFEFIREFKIRSSLGIFTRHIHVPSKNSPHPVARPTGFTSLLTASDSAGYGAKTRILRCVFEHLNFETRAKRLNELQIL